jgi:hypothetical protein
MCAGLYGRRPCSLASPVPFAAADVIHPVGAQTPEFHYAIIEVRPWGAVDTSTASACCHRRGRPSFLCK